MSDPYDLNEVGRLQPYAGMRDVSFARAIRRSIETKSFEALLSQLHSAALAEERVRERHRPVFVKVGKYEHPVCAHCWESFDGAAVDVDWPCPTIKDMEG